MKIYPCVNMLTEYNLMVEIRVTQQLLDSSQYVQA